MFKRTIACVGMPPQISAGLKASFNSELIEVVELPSAQSLISNINKYRINLLVIYNLLPDLKECQELCIALKANPAMETVPIMVVSHADDKPQEKIKMLKGGLIDVYVNSGSSIEELTAYANVFLQRYALEEELQMKNDLLKKLSVTDELTKLHNRRFLINSMEEELKRIARYDYSLSILMLDLDHFKKINDKYGHTQGDSVLEKMASIIKKSVRSVDIPCRYGGEEFITIFPFTNYAGVYEVAERLRKRIEDYNFGSEEKPLKCTASIGLVSIDGNDDCNVDSAFRVLDRKLYEAKNSGRNKVCGGIYKELAKG